MHRLIESTDGVKLHCIANESDSSHCLLIIPGWNSSITRDTYSSITELAREHYTVIRCDIRGQGQSEGNMGDCTIERAAEDMAHVTKKFAAIYKQLTILGYSAGGEIALRIVQRGYLRVDKLILVSSGLGRGLTNSADNSSRENYWHIIQQFAGCTLSEYKKMLDSIDIPVHLIHGAEDDRVPLSQSQELQAWIGSNASLRIMQGVKHKPETPEKFEDRNELIMTALSS